MRLNRCPIHGKDCPGDDGGFFMDGNHPDDMFGVHLMEKPMTENPQKRKPENFLESHALESLKAEPTWTLSMYAAYNDLEEDTTERLHEFLKPHLPEGQLR